MVTKEKLSATFLGGKRRGPSMAHLDNGQKEFVHNISRPRKRGPLMAHLDSGRKNIVHNVFRLQKRGSLNGTPR